MVDPRFA